MRSDLKNLLNDFTGMALALAVFALGLVTLQLNTGKLAPSLIGYAVLFAVLFTSAHIAKRILSPKSDRLILPLVTVLCGLGLIEISRIDAGSALSQSLWILIGLAAYVAVIRFFKDYDILASFKYICGALGIILLLSAMFFGKEVNGARLWLSFGGLHFQPSELSKVFLIIFFAGYLDENKEILSQGFGRWQMPSMRHLGPLLLVWAFSLAILIFQKDLGSSLLFFGTFVAMVFIATDRIAYAGAGALLFAIGSFLSYRIFPHLRLRMEAWLNPWADPSGKGYQILQSVYALAAGGLFGAGIGLGRFKIGEKLLLPAVSTDFIFSALAEEIGLIGIVAVSIVYLLLVYRAFKVATTAEDSFGALLAAGIGSAIGLQFLVIVSGVIRLAPMTGITLPFISYGGSSILSNFILIGLLDAIAGSRGRVKI